MHKTKSDVIRLRHMYDASMKAVRFVAGKKREDFTSDELLTLGLIRLIEIIGEAASKVSKDIRLRHPSIIWKEIIGTRNRLIHAYDQVNLDILWHIVTSDLPVLVEQLRQAIEQEETDEQQKLF